MQKTLAVVTFALFLGLPLTSSAEEYKPTELNVTVGGNESTAASADFLENNYVSQTYALPELGKRAQTVEIVLGDYAKTAVHLGGIQNFLEELMKATPTVDEAAVYKQQRALLTPIVESIDAAELATPGSQKAIQDAIKATEAASKQAIEDLKEANAALMAKNADAIKKAEAALGNLQVDLKNQMSWFWTNQAMPIFVAQDTNAEFGIKLYPLVITEDGVSLGEQKDMPRHILNYNTIKGTDTKVLNVFWVSRQALRSNDQNGFQRAIWGARDIARVNANNVLNASTEVGGMVGHTIIAIQMSDSFMAEDTIINNLKYRGVQADADVNFLLGK